MESGDAVICGGLNGEMAKLGLKGVWVFVFCFCSLGQDSGVLIIAIAVFSATKLEIERWNWNNAFSFPLGKQVVLLAVYLPGRPSKGIIDCSCHEQCRVNVQAGLSTGLQKEPHSISKF